MKTILHFLLACTPLFAVGQGYTSYFTGNSSDLITIPNGGICLMGGASEDDNAMKWFLEKANGGDVLVLRASGSDGYNDYLYSDLGITVNSVETIVCNNATASDNPYVLQKIEQAEAIWFAGGDQWDYISYWRNTPVDSAVNAAISERNIVIGGTSAGMAIQGKFYFSAQIGTVSSATALSNPYNSFVTVDSTSFIKNDLLGDVITDTHFDSPDRKGRLVTFLARIYTDYGIFGKAIACDEYTAVCIETDGTAKVFGDHPSSDDNAYFIQSNCELTNQAPENCSQSNPLTWNLNEEALKVYQIKGNSTGSNSFNLNTWQSGSGGTWNDWSVLNGVLTEQSGAPINCSVSVEESSSIDNVQLVPNPVEDYFTLTVSEELASDYEITIINQLGQSIQVEMLFKKSSITFSCDHLPAGIYTLLLKNSDGTSTAKRIIKK
ncbi:MAG: T9SS type A sorting domain-containing protein [Bacteroidota bacterium]